MFSTPISKCVAIGDSVTEGGYDGTPWPYRLTRLNGQYYISAIYADGGKTSFDVLKEQVPLALASGASHCFTQFGTNDFTGGWSQGTTRANAISIWKALRAGGVEPIHVGLQPVSNSTNFARACAFNLWAKTYCRQNQILYIDIMPLMADGGTGGYKTGLGYDAVHPSSVGMGVIAKEVSAQTTRPYALTPTLAECDYDFMAYNAFSLNKNAISMVDTNTDGVPDNYYEQGTGGVVSIQPVDTDGYGKWLRATLTADTNYGFGANAINMSNNGWAVGDRIVAAYRVRWVDVNQALVLNAKFTGITAAAGSDTFSMYNEQASTNTGDDCFIYHEATIGTTFSGSIGYEWLGTGTGYFEVNRPVIYNLTQMGLV